MARVVIFGGGGHASVIMDILELTGHEVVGIIENTRRNGPNLGGYKLIGTDEEIIECIHSYNIEAGVIAIGDNLKRKTIAQNIKKIVPEFMFHIAIHPNAVVSKSAQVKPGTVIFAGAIVNSSSEIGEHCIINTNASLDHDCVMGGFSSLAPGVVTGGNVSIGACSSVNIGSVISNNIKIGDHCVIGAGSMVITDIKGHCLAFGSPAKIIKKQ